MVPKKLTIYHPLGSEKAPRLESAGTLGSKILFPIQDDPDNSNSSPHSLIVVRFCVLVAEINVTVLCSLSTVRQQYESRLL